MTDTCFLALQTVKTSELRSNDGISFNGDTAAANALDDYEEGAWTLTTFNKRRYGYYLQLPCW